MNDTQSPESGAPEPVDLLAPGQQVELDTARRMASVIGLWLPLLLVAVGTIVTAMWIPRMPDPMAIHWGVDMQPDGFGPPWSAAAMALGVGLLIVALYCIQALQVWQSRHRGGPIWSSMFRFVPAMVFGTAVLIETIAVGTAALQLDAEDARETGSTGLILLVAGLLWVIATVADFLVQPKVEIERPSASAAKPLPLQSTERAVWVSQVSTPKPMLWFLGIVVALLAGATIWAFGLPGPVGWIMLATLVVMLIAAMSTLWYRVRISDEGLVATAALGWPVIRVKANEIEQVQALHVVPFAEFGGWGLRWAPGRFGLVLRTGEGILVSRKGKRDFVVTVDDAEAGAALLAAVAQTPTRVENDQTGQD